MLQIGRVSHCKLIEHLIINKNSYYSFRDNGIIEELKVSPKFVPSFLYKQWQEERKEEWIDQGKQEGEKSGIEKGAYQRALEMARKMILAKEPMEKIKAFTMRTHQQIGRLKSRMENENRQAPTLRYKSRVRSSITAQR